MKMALHYLVRKLAKAADRASDGLRRLNSLLAA